MVTNVTSFARSGLADFVVQRATAVVLALYTVLLVIWFATHADPDYAAITGFFGNPAMKAFSTLALLSTIAHAWIGMWTVGTDYIRPHYFGGGATVFRLIYQAGCMLALFVYVLWGSAVIWSI